jgi:hypothetical protein
VNRNSLTDGSFVHARKCGINLPPGTVKIWSRSCWGWNGPFKMTGTTDPYPHWWIEPDERGVN